MENNQINHVNNEIIDDELLLMPNFIGYFILTIEVIETVYKFIVDSFG